MRFHIDLNNCPTTYLVWQRSIKHFLKHFQLLWISQKSSNFNSLQRDVAETLKSSKNCSNFLQSRKWKLAINFYGPIFLELFPMYLKNFQTEYCLWQWGVRHLQNRAQILHEIPKNTTLRKLNGRRRPDGKSMILHYFPFRTKRLNNPTFWHE